MTIVTPFFSCIISVSYISVWILTYRIKDQSMGGPAMSLFTQGLSRCLGPTYFFMPLDLHQTLAGPSEDSLMRQADSREPTTLQQWVTLKVLVACQAPSYTLRNITVPQSHSTAT